jgi:ribonuclease HI
MSINHKNAAKVDSKYTLFFDGCSKGNPGKAGAGAVLYRTDDDNTELTEIWACAEFVGLKQTNNYAEYMGLILGLTEAVKKGLTNLLVKGDSLLIIKQMQGVYQVNAPHLQPLYQQAIALVKIIGRVEFEHVYRNKNKRADELANKPVVNDLYLQVKHL